MKIKKEVAIKTLSLSKMKISNLRLNSITGGARHSGGGGGAPGNPGAQGAPGAPKNCTVDPER